MRNLERERENKKARKRYRERKSGGAESLRKKRRQG